jgi:hypothetical protein
VSVVQEGLIDDVVKLLYDEALLRTVTKEEAERFGGAFCQGMCKKPKWLAIAILAAIDCKEKKPEEAKWGSDFCFYDLSPKGRSMLYTNGDGRGILICPGVITPVVTP